MFSKCLTITGGGGGGGRQHAQHVLALATTRCVHVRSTVNGSLNVNTAHVTFN